MRAHKFSLVWLGYAVDDLGERRKGYVGGSVMRGRDTETHLCLAEIGRTLGFTGGQGATEPLIGVRNLDRNRRMMPAGMQVNLGSQIQQRMHQEYVIGYYKRRPGER
jgi:hypothetical protein